MALVKPRACSLACTSATAAPESPDPRGSDGTAPLTRVPRAAPGAPASDLQVSRELLEQLTLALGSHDASGRLPVLEKDQGGDAHHIEPPGDVQVVVDVQLGHLQLALLLGGDLLEYGGDHLARATPFGPEVHEDRNVCGLDMLIKASVTQGGN